MHTLLNVPSQIDYLKVIILMVTLTYLCLYGWGWGNYIKTDKKYQVANHLDHAQCVFGEQLHV